MRMRVRRRPLAAMVAAVTLGGWLLAAAGPAAAQYSSQITLPFTGLSGPNGLTVDAAGDVFVADTYNNRVVELPAGATSSSQQVTLPFTLQDFPEGVTVDAAGNVYSANYDSGGVSELPAGATSSSQMRTLPFTGVANALGVAVDGAGNVYVADVNQGRIVALPAGATSSSQQVTLPMAFWEGYMAPPGPGNVAVDAAGDVFASDGSQGNSVYELPRAAPIAAQSISFTAPAAGVIGQPATLTATGGASGNPVVFSVDPVSGSGVCAVSGANGAAVSYAAAGSCVIDANQAGTLDYTAAPQVTKVITVDQAPAFVLDSPPSTAVARQQYGYPFVASGTTAPAYALASGAPSWLSVNASTGVVTGTPPAGTTSFSYAVTAANASGSVTAGPFRVSVGTLSLNTDVSASLSCPVPADMTLGGTATCTLTAAAAGTGLAPGVVAGVALPAALSEVSCTPSCTRHANVFTWNVTLLTPSSPAKLSITVRANAAGMAQLLAAVAAQGPDQNPSNNAAAWQVSIIP